jgi:hypothetical protein
MPRLGSPVWEGVPHVRSTRDVCGLLVNGVSEGREAYPILQGGVLGASTHTFFCLHLDPKTPNE